MLPRAVTRVGLLATFDSPTLGASWSILLCTDKTCKWHTTNVLNWFNGGSVHMMHEKLCSLLLFSLFLPVLIEAANKPSCHRSVISTYEHNYLTHVTSFTTSSSPP